jgi:hypothetical protein
VFQQYTNTSLKTDINSDMQSHPPSAVIAIYQVTIASAMTEQGL